MSEDSGSGYRFGPFRYDPAQRSLFKGDALVPLAPKAADTLHVLLERRGQVVGRDELMKAVWPDCVVEEVGLARNISLLRKAMGDEGERYIETVPKRGYRFAGEIETVAAPVSPPSWRHGVRWLVAAGVLAFVAVLVYWQFYRPSRFAPTAGRLASLAVVPVEYLGSKLERSGFAEGLSEALVEEVARLEAARVVSPSTVQRYRRLRIPTAVMARLLGLDVIVEGSAQRFEGRVRVSLRLSDVHSGKLIWAEAFEPAAADLGVAQATVARAAAAQIERRLAGGRHQ